MLDRINISINPVLTVAGLVIIIFGMQAAYDLLMPMMMALLLTIIAVHPSRWLRSKGLNASVAALIVVGVIVLVIIALGLFIAGSANRFLAQMPTYAVQLENEINNLLSTDVPGFESGIQLDVLMAEQFTASRVMSLVSSVFAALGAVLANAFTILFIFIFILLEANDFGHKFQVAMGASQEALNKLSDFNAKLEHYMVLKSYISAGTGILAAGSLALLGVDYPLLWGFFTFLMNFIPNIGSIIAAIPPVILGFVQGGLPLALAVAGVYLAINLLFGYIVEPKVMGSGMGISTAVVFISLIFWGWVFGIVGMFLSVPLTIALKFGLELNDQTRGLGLLLGSDIPEDAELERYAFFHRKYDTEAIAEAEDAAT